VPFVTPSVTPVSSGRTGHVRRRPDNLPHSVVKNKLTIWDWVNGNPYRTLVENSSDVQEAKKFAEDFKPKDGYDYHWIIDSALKEGDYVRDAIEGMDSKADSIIGYVGAAEGILTLATAYVAIDPNTRALAGVSGPTLAFFLAAIGYALAVRAPADHPGFPSARDAFKNESKKQGEAVFAAEMMMRSRAARVIINKKGNLTRRSYQLFFLGTAWFVFASILYVLCRAIFP
jgi:hypothetical protein